MSDQAKSQNTFYAHRKTLHEPVVAKHITFYKDGDHLFGGVKMALHPRRYRKFDTLLADLTKRIPGLAFGVRSVFTPRGRDVVTSLDGMIDEGEYICSTYRHRAQGLDLARVAVPNRWRFAKPRSANKELNEILGDVDIDDRPPLRKLGKTGAADAFNSRQPKKLTVMKNGEPTVRHVVLLNRKTAQSFEQVLTDISDMFQMSVHKLFTLHGKRVRGLTQLLNGPDALVAAGRESFKAGYAPVPPSGAPRGRPHLQSRARTQGSVASRLRDRRDRLMKTKGHWTVWLTTSDLATAGTKSQVTITVYGHKGVSRPIPLGYADGQHFQSGHIDEFDISVGSVGEIYKIRIAHDNTGEFPGWLCDEVRMKDKDTSEELVFPCKRWMARGEDDHEICRELPASRRGDPTLPIIKYEVTVETGELWNAGTNANVYLTIYGDRGDTGVRQLYSESSQKCFKKGQTDHFTVEAVSLGHIKRIIVGHDGSGAGSGWFLEKITIRDPSARQHEQLSKFYCGKWLDEGEGDGKIVRELLVQEEYMDDIMEKRNWEHERWKFENRNMVMFYSQLTGKALRVKGDGTVDGLGEEKEKGAMFTVHARKSFNRIFGSVLNKNFHLAISEAKLLGQGRGGPYCEFRVRVQADRTVILESVKYPLQFITIQEDGKPGDVRGLIDREPSRCFHVYCKGMFRHRGIVMLRTSNSQAVSVDHDNSLIGTGKLNRAAHFRVHKVTEGGVRMLESMINPGKYVRLKDGHLDCLGSRDEDSHFIVEKHRDKGYVTLQSAAQRGIYMGLSPEGLVRPTVDTGVNNVWLFPSVVEFGVPKQHSQKVEAEPSLIPSPSPASKQTTVSPRAEIEEGDWKITVNSSSSLQFADVAIVAYGNQGNSGAIVLAAPVQNGPLFQDGSMDEFKANFAKVGKLYKIRMELIAKSRTKDPSWRVKDVRMLNLLSEEKLHFNFNNRWLSRKHDDRDIMRELPAVWPGEKTPEVYKYQVRVYTGKEEGADTKASVYLQIFGEKGDTGKRTLLRSNNPKPFQPGQLDIFEVEAVDLGALDKVLVGHDGTGTGQGWYLDEIVIRKGPSGEEDNIFACNRWLDSGMDDRKIERLLLARDPVPVKVKSARISSAVVPIQEAVVPVEEAVVATAMSEEMVFGMGSKSKTESSKTPTDSAFHSAAKQDLDDSDLGLVSPKRSTPNDMKSPQDLLEDLPKMGDPPHTPSGISGDQSQSAKETPRESDGTVRETPASQPVSEELVFDDDDEIDIPLDSSGELDEKKEVVAAAVVTPVEETKVEEVKAESVAEVKEEEVEEIKEEEKFNEGDWKVFVTTGLNDGLSLVGDVFLFVYGSSGKYVGPLTLGSARDGQLQLGETAEFKINLGTKLGDIFKIRIGHEDDNPEMGLFVEKVTMQDMISGEQLDFLMNRWMSRSRDDRDIWRESPVVGSGREHLSVVIYEITVETGDAPGSDTDAAVYVLLHGDRGDSGKRRLYQSKTNPDPFECGMKDVFLLEAVSLGNLQKLTVEHDGKGSRPGWFLKNVVVKDAKDPDSEIFFSCDRWLDKDQDDGKIQRELKPSKRPSTPPASPPHGEDSKGEFKLWVKTGTQSGPAHGGKVTLTAYGEKGVSKDIPLFAPSPQSRLFEPGNVDEFELSLGEIGDLYKLRVAKEELDRWSAWHLEEVKLLDKDTKEEFLFRFDRWFSRQKDDFDIVRELPVVKNDQPVLPVRHYQVRVYTGNHWAAETDARVVVHLYGNKGDTGERTLFHSTSGGRKFQAGQVDVFDLEAVSLEGLQQVVVKHDGKGHGAGMFLDKVVVMETDGDEPNMQYIFPCGQWLDEGEGDGQTERTLRLIDATDKVLDSTRRSPNTTRGDWRVVITTSDMDGAGTQAQVYLTLFGSAGRSHRQGLGLANPASDQFERGSVADFEIRAGDVGRLSKVRLEHDNTNNDPGWHIDYIKLTDMDTEEEYVLYADCWISAEEGLCKEFPIVRPESRPLPVLQYVVVVETGSDADSEAPRGSVLVNLHGEEGDTGLRPLQTSLTSSELWSRGHADVFVLEAVSLGSLEKLELIFDGEGEESSWYVSRVRVLESTSALRETIFNCQRWMVLEDGNEKIAAEFTVTAVQFASPLPDQVEEKLRGRKSARSRGNYLAYLETGSQEDAGTTDNVCMVVYGVKGHTEPVLLNGHGALSAGSTLKTQIRCGIIGQIFKVRIFFQEHSSQSSWFLQWLKLKDEDTDEEFNFPFNDWVQSSEGNANGTVELPVIRPDLQPLQEMTYMVTVSTGDVALAETEAHVSLCLAGDWGDSGEKQLLESQAAHKPFQRGQKDEFTIMTLDLGALKSVKLSHSFMGRGQGWYCEQVTIRPLVFNDVPTDTIFPCHRWLDTGCDDRMLTRELLPLARIPTVGPPSASQTSRGIWTCLLTTATTEESGVAQQSQEISLTVYGSGGKAIGPLELTASDRQLFKPGRTDDFPGLDLGDIGEIQKIRVCAGQEDKEHVWSTKEVLLQDEQTRQTLKFDFTRWVGEVNGDIRKELPVIRPRESFPRLVQYQVQLVTGSEGNAGTQTKVFITLYGTKSDSGRRVLASSCPPVINFQPGQTKTFIVEAVDLGDLTKVVVGKSPGDPWFLEKVLIKPGVFAPAESIFLFNRWIGGEDGRSKEVEETAELTDVGLSQVAVPLEESDSMFPKSRGHWRIETVGGENDGEGDNSDLVITFCGDKGESTPIPLNSGSDKPFQPGQKDTFDVQVIDEVGDLFKVRLGFNDRSQPKALHLRQVRCEDQDTHDVFVCEVTRPLQVTEEVDGCLELPIQWPALFPLPVVTYRVEVHTGEVKPQSKNSNAYVEVYGVKGSTGRRQLKKSLTYDDKFETDQIDLFEIQAVFLMEVNKVVIGHDSAGPDSGWFLKRVVISESLSMRKRYVFECNKWLDESEDDAKVERTLHLSKEPRKGSSPTRDSAPSPKALTPKPPTPKSATPKPPTPKSFTPKPPTPKSATPKPPTPKSDTPRPPTPKSATPKPPTPKSTTPKPPTPKSATPRPPTPKSATPKPPTPKSVTPVPVASAREPTPQPAVKGHAWKVSTTTGPEEGEGTTGTVVLVLYGDKGVSSPVVIGDEEGFRFEEGHTDMFEVMVDEDVGDLYKIRVGFKSQDHELSWYADYTGSPSWFPEKVQLHNVEEDKEYVFDAKKWIQLDEHSDYWREFPVSVDEDSYKQPLSVYNYMVTVFTGDVSGGGTDADVYLKLWGEEGDSGFRHLHGSRTHNNKFEQGNKDVFFLEAVDLGKLTKVSVRQDGSGLGSEWFLDKVEVKITEDDPIIHVFTCDKWLKDGESEDLPMSEVIDDFTDKPEEPVAGQEWLILVTTSGDAGSGTDAKVSLTVCGDKGSSGALELGNPGEGFFQPGSTDRFDILLDPDEIGEILKIRLEHDNSGDESAWNVEEVIMRHVASGEELVFPVNQQLSLDEKFGDIVVEIPAPRKGENSLSVCTYVVQIMTSDEAGAGTDSNVYIKLIGAQGDSGNRFLIHSLEEGDMFEAGKQDTFHVKAVDLGRLSRVVVGHDNSGVASGWKLGSIRIREESSKEVFLFNYDKWLDGDKDDSITEAEIDVTDVLMEEDSDPVNASVDGDEEEKPETS